MGPVSFASAWQRTRPIGMRAFKRTTSFSESFSESFSVQTFNKLNETKQKTKHVSIGIFHTLRTYPIILLSNLFTDDDQVIAYDIEFDITYSIIDWIDIGSYTTAHY
jgi:hypothetical protein